MSKGSWILTLPIFCLLAAPPQATTQPANQQPTTAPPGNEVQKVGNGVTAPTLIFKVDPEYPEKAGKARLEGMVRLYFEVNEQGVPQNPRVIKGLGLGLDEAAIEALMKWRFRPGLKNGKPVTTQAQAQVNFRLLRNARVNRAGRNPPLSKEPVKPNPPSNTAAPEADKNAPTAGKRGQETSSPKKDVDFFDTAEACLGDSSNRLRLRSENFQLTSDWKDEGRLGQVLLALERARALFFHLYGQVPPGVVPVIVNQSLEETRSACRTSEGMGCYLNRTGAHSIVLSKAAVLNGMAAPAVHEYTHLVQNLMGYAWAPPWVAEGIAGYYESVEFKTSKLYVGYFNPRRTIPGWMQVDSVLSMDGDALNRGASLASGQAFYAEAHLLVHMLRHTPRYAERLEEFLGAVKNGADSREALRQFYGVSASQLNDELVEYYRRGKYQKVEVYEGITVPNSVMVDGSGHKVTVKEKKCTWCSVGKAMRHFPIIIPL